MTFVPDQPRPERVELQASSAELALLTRAAALAHVDLPRFVLEAAHERAESMVAGVERVSLSERDSLRVMELLENPPEPNARLLAAARLRLDRGSRDKELTFQESMPRPAAQRNRHSIL